MTPRRRTDLIVIHCSATPPSHDIGRNEIGRWHIQRGFRAVGYHWIIRRDGTIEAGRREDLQGAHAVEVNARSVGVCLVGGVAERDRRTAEDNFTAPQWAALENLVADILSRYPDSRVLGHRDIPGVRKDCPCFDARDWARRQGFAPAERILP